MPDTVATPHPAEPTASDPDVATDQPDAAASRRLKVALFTDNYGPGHSGLLYAVQFVEGELLKQGHEVVVVAPQCSGPNPYKDHPNRSEYRLPAIKLPGLPMAVARGKGFERAIEHFKANPPDVIHVQGLGSVGMLGVWAADQAEVPLAVTWHTDFEAYADHYAHLTPFLDAFYRLIKLNTQGMKRPSLSSLRGWLRNRPRGIRGLGRRNILNAARDMLEAADLVTTPSDKTAHRVKELAPRAHVRVEPNGVDALPVSEPLAPAPGPRIIYVGRIAPEKGIPLLLAAFDWVREEVPDAELMFVGDWRASTVLKQKLAAARRRGGVTLVGQVPRDRVGAFLQSADVFVFSSQTDTQALVLHEAAHAGLPIVSADRELRLVIDEGVNGLIARPTPESLARQLVTMLRNVQDEGFRARASARSREMASWYTIDNQTQAMVQLYEDLAARRPIPERMVIEHP